MDNTETYIKMCDCPEIQGAKGEYDEHDYSYLGENYAIGDLEDEVWLPRQDQLQEMVTDKIDCPSHSAFAIIVNLAHRLNKMSEATEDFNYWIEFTSMEQLWLAFVMKTLHLKQWSGTEWLEIS